MAKRGTRVGNAYIALTVDGDNINKDIADSLDDVDYDALGDKHSRDYLERIDKNLKKGLGKDFKKHMKNMDKALAVDDLVAARTSKMLAKAVDKGQLDTLFKKVGRDAGAKFGKEFDDVVKVSVMNSLERALNDAARNGNKASLKDILFTKDGAHILGPAFDRAVRDAERGIKQLAATREREYAKLFDTIERMEEAAAKASADREQAWIKANEKMRLDWIRESAKERDRLAAASQSRTEQWERANEKFKLEGIKNIAAQREKNEKAIHALIERSTANQARREKLIWDVRNKSAKAHAKYLRDLDRGRIDAFGNAVSGNRTVEKSFLGSLLGSMMSGRAFGRGSRMDGLHYIGGLMGLLVKTVVGGMKLIGKAVSTFATAFSRGMENAGASATNLQRIMSGFVSVGSGMMSAIGQLIATGPAGLAALAAMLAMVAVSAGVVFAAIVVLASAISALAGIVTAFVGVLTLGLVGGLTVLGATIGPVIAAAGLLTAAFMSLTDAQKKTMKEAFTPLREQMVGIGQVILEDLIPAFQQWSSNLQRAVQLTVPAASVMGAAFAEAGNIITAALSGPGFQNFATMMAVYLPRIVINLSTAFGNFMNGLMGMFASLTPLVLRFTQYLSDVTARFSEWANSAEGQNSIVNFAEKAVVALQSLWGFIVATGGLLRDLLWNDTMQSEGVAMFDGMIQGIDRLRVAVQEMVADGRMQKWMEEARDFGSALWAVIVALGGTFQALSDSGTIEAVSNGLRTFAGWLDEANRWIEPLAKGVGIILPPAFEALLAPINLARAGLENFIWTVDQTIAAIGRIPLLGRAAKLLGITGGGGSSPAPRVAPTPFASGLVGPRSDFNRSTKPTSRFTLPKFTLPKLPSANDLITSGRTALAGTNLKTPGSAGSSASRASAPDWVNPYKGWAESLIRSGPSVAAEVRKALRGINKSVKAAVKDATKAVGSAEARQALQGMITSMKDTGKSMIETARSDLDTAARSLASATTPEAAAEAMRDVKRAQKAITAAQKAQQQIRNAAARLARQKIVTSFNVKDLLAGIKVETATLADYARARARMAVKIEKANQKLTEAIALRDDYRTAVTDSIKSFGSLVSAQAQVIDGVEQALTHSDITGNLKDRLAQIKAFQSNMNILISQGLSNAAYKQLIDAGVETGGQYAAAIVAGGVGAVDQTNLLVGQIDTIANSLGVQTSNRMYQAGVDTARGLVEGLSSLDKELDTAAGKLGKIIAKAVKRELNSKSPSRVMISEMDNVGDGVVVGLGAQHRKVDSAAASLAGRISMSSSPQYAMAGGASSTQVSGNPGNSSDPRIRDLHIHTPTTDPKAVAYEALNEIVGRL